MSSKSKLEFLVKNFSIRPGTVDYGRDYEFKITSLISLRCVELKIVQDMWLAANVDDCGAFDDIVLFIEVEGRESITYLIQLKHQIDVKNIAVGEFKSKRDFVLRKYHDTIRDIKNSQNNSEMMNHVKDNLDKTVFIIYTNRGTNANDVLIQIDKNSDTDVKWMLSRLINTNGNIFKFNYNKLGMTIDNDIKYITEENLFLFTKQLHVNEVDAEIEKVVEKIIKPLKLPKNILSDVIKKYTFVITQWSKGELGGHYLLTKNLINNVLFELFLAPYMKKLEHEINQNTHLLDLENETIWSVIVQDYPLIVIEWDEMVTRFLNDYINKEIKIYSEDETNMNLWKRHVNEIKKSILRNVGRAKKIRPFEAYEYLWKNGHLPLILQVNVNEFEDVLQIIKRLECKIKVIILLEKLPLVKNPIFVKSLKDLKHEHRMKILEKEVNFQSRISIKLLDILPEKLQEFVSIRNVIYILLGKFNVGNTYESLPEIFIQRTLKKVWITPTVFNDITDEIFVVEYSSGADLEGFRKKYKLKFENLNLSLWQNSTYLDDHRIFSTSKIETMEFQCVNKTVHFLALHGKDNLEWIQSIGNLSNFSMYRKKSDFDTSKVNQILTNFNHDKPSSTVVISDNPGMGKSVLLDYIALHAPTNAWIIKINLYDYVSFYKTENFEDLCRSPCQYLTHFACKILTKQKRNDILTQSIFADYLDSKRILLLLDGFDEVPVRFHGAVKKMIKAIHEAKYCIYVTTRPLLKQQLEDILDTLSISINPFSRNDKITYLTEHFHKTIGVLTPENEKQTKIFVDKLLESAKQNLQKQDEEFTGIPLQIKLLAEVFTDSFKQFLQTNHFINENFDLLYLYRKFIEQKTEIVCDRYGNSFDDVQHNYKILRSMYALKLVFGKTDLKDLNIDERLKIIAEILPNTFQLMQKDGIVIVEDEDNVTFVHRTFAEYLTAEWLSENISTKHKETMRVLAQKTFDQNYIVVRNIFDRILARNYPLHTAAINREVDVIKEALLKDLTVLNQVDDGNRSLLHIIAAWGIHHPHEPVSKNYNEVDDEHRDMLFELYDDVVKDNPIVDILKSIPNHNFICTKDGLFNYTPLDYSILSGSLKIGETICAKLKNLDNWISITNFNLHYINYYAEQCIYDSLRSWAYKHYVTTKLNNDQDNYACSPFHSAIIRAETGTIQNLLQSCKIDVNIRDASGKTPLHWATIKGHAFAIQILCSQDIDINSVDNYGMTALHYAILTCTKNQKEVISELLKNKPNLNILDHTGNTALHHAVHYNLESCLKLFLDSELANTDILEVKDNEEETLLISAAKAGNTPLVDLMLSFGADIKAEDKVRDTALHWAANNGHVDTVDLLLAKGADAKAYNKFQRTPLGLATFLGRKDVVKLFLSKTNVNIDDKEDTGLLTLLHYAAWKGHIELVDLFLSMGADLEVADKYGFNALLYATHNQHQNVVELLISKGASVNLKDDEHTTPLISAANTGNEDITEFLILKGADIEAKNIKGKTALSVAAYNSNIEVIDLLLKKKANIEARDVRGLTALHWAAKKGKVEAVEFLLENGANLEAQDEDGRTPLILAARKNHISVVNALLSVGANINAYDNECKTPICWAAMRGHADVVDLLLAAGADFEMRDNEHMTPLEWAQKNGHTTVVTSFSSK
ncbi:hypothetical protein ILUMI_23582 [Ignelater luminosus]|uniref:NACHT domain-containing protein n=1 Tax=Ignelater luminosus TaxID=2038154 RepID=A0A8K0CF02_IGNLU|nr:hypothetical protein ILUMI_23582 [Ignelater luminosus]